MTPDETNPNHITILTSDDVALDAELVLPKRPKHVAVLCHPHPLHGGVMDVPLFDHLLDALSTAAIGVLRFNFRGCGRSGGSFGYGDDEQTDVRAAVARAIAEAPEAKVALVGWSFGADLALTCVDPGVAGWFLIAPPLRSIAMSDMVASQEHGPKLIAAPAHDQFNPPKIASETVADWTNTTVVTIAGADHSLIGKSDEIAKRAVGFVSAL